MQRNLPDVKARYRVVDEIAQGGMGTVFVGLQTDGTGRITPVAIKRLHAHLIEDESAVGSFADEARIASIMHHPNLVRVHEITPIEGQLVIVMDWVEGVALNVLAKKRAEPLPVPVIRRILVDALDGLHAAHELKDDAGSSLGIIHRDISPQNLLVGADGLTRVTDFGIAMAKGRLAPTTIQGGVKGKVPYLSPEQVNRATVDRRSDIFAAGAVAWELLAGKRLFQAGSEGEVLAMILREPLVPPSSVRLDVPLDLDETVLKALERKTDRRFQTAAEFAKAIEAGGPVASYDEVGRAVLAHAGASIAARRQKLAKAREQSVDARSLEEEMTATIVVPTPPTSRRPSALNADRIVIAPSLPPPSIPPPPPSLPPPSIVPPSIPTSLPSLPPTATTGQTMTKLPGRSTTSTLVAGIVALAVAIILVVKFSGNDRPRPPSFPAAPQAVVPTTTTQATTTTTTTMTTPPDPTPTTTAASTTASTVTPPQIKPHRPIINGHRSRADAGPPTRSGPFMPDDL